jgi:plasmid stability protein
MQNACMTTITVRDVPEDVHAELVRRAAAHGQSLQEYVKGTLIEKAKKPDMAALIRRIEERLEKSDTSLTSDQIVEFIRERRGPW